MSMALSAAWDQFEAEFIDFYSGVDSDQLDALLNKFSVDCPDEERNLTDQDLMIVGDFLYYGVAVVFEKSHEKLKQMVDLGESIEDL